MVWQTQRLSATFPELWEAIEQEAARQEAHLELIASENYASPAVLEAAGTVLTNKYAEGYPGKRYYGGCLHVDTVEQLAIDTAKELFDAAYVNVQPHAGSQANAAVFLALCEPGDTLLSLGLSDGGHLTHGSPVNFSGKYFQVQHYHLNADGWIDMDHVRSQALTHRPKVLVAGCSAYPREVDWAGFRAVADEVGAYLMVDMAHVAGLVAADLHTSPLPYADVVTTTTHKTLRGARGGMILCGHNSQLPKACQSALFPGTQGGPLMHQIAAKAVAFKEALAPSFRTYQAAVIQNAQAMAGTLVSRGYPVQTGGTDNHLMLVNLMGKAYTGKDAERWLEDVGITTNKNSVPGDPRSPFQTSGLRLGTPAMTTRGLDEQAARQVAHWIADALDHVGDASVQPRLAEEVRALCEAHPVYAART